MKIDSIKFVLFLALFVLLLVPAAFAEKLTFAPTADAYFGSDVRDQANNTEILTCQWAEVPDSGTINVAWIKFDIQGLGSEIVESARLDIAAAPGTGDVPPVILVVTAPNDWEEGQLTWDNHPKMNETILSGWFPEESPADQQIISFPIPPQTIENGELTLALVPQPGDSTKRDIINFHSSTSAIPPMLTVYTNDATPVEQEIIPVGDQHINRGNPDATALNGLHVAIAIQYIPPVGGLYGIIKFDLSTIGDRYVSEATLEMTQGHGSGFHNGPSIALRVCGNDWEEGISWNTRPLPESLCVGGLMQDTAVVNNGDVIEFPIATQAFKDKDFLSLLMVPQPGNELWWGWDNVGIANNAAFHSLDGTDIPILIVKTVGTTNIADKDVRNPMEFSLNQNYPNPFNPSTTLSYNLSENADVKLDIYNVLGEKITSLVNGSKNAGVNTVRWNGMNANGQKAISGVYFARLTANVRGNSHTDIKKIILLK